MAFSLVSYHFVCFHAILLEFSFGLLWTTYSPYGYSYDFKIFVSNRVKTDEMIEKIRVDPRGCLSACTLPAFAPAPHIPGADPRADLNPFPFPGFGLIPGLISNGPDLDFRPVS